jgi:hypothetical protein
MTRRRGMRVLGRRAPGAAFVLVLATAASASAQTRGTLVEPRIEVGGGAGASGGLALGERDANLLGNNPGGTPFRWFSSESRLLPAPFVEGRLGYRLTPRLTTEARLTIARPVLRVSVSADAENAASVDADEALTEYALEGGVLWRLAGGARRRWIPFASGGAGVAVHVHERQSLAETAISGYAGAGALYVLGSRTAAARRSTGIRFDARVQFLHGGLASDNGASRRAVASASVFVAF